jgi:hypothetical protein
MHTTPKPPQSGNPPRYPPPPALPPPSTWPGSAWCLWRYRPSPRWHRREAGEAPALPRDEDSSTMRSKRPSGSQAARQETRLCTKSHTLCPRWPAGMVTVRGGAVSRGPPPRPRGPAVRPADTPPARTLSCGTAATTTSAQARAGSGAAGCRRQYMADSLRQQPHLVDDDLHVTVRGGQHRQVGATADRANQHEAPVHLDQ